MRLVRNHGVTAPAGFKAAAVNGVAVVVNEGPDLAAAVVGSSESDGPAAVQWTKQVGTTGKLRAVLVHSGSPGTSASAAVDFGDVHRVAEQVAGTLTGWGTDTGAIEVAVCATGSSGAPAPLGSLLVDVAEAVHELAGGIVGGEEAARTVTARGRAVLQVTLEHEDGWTLAGMTDSEGTVCVLTTDVVAPPTGLGAIVQAALVAHLPSARHATVVMMASGASELHGAPRQLVDATVRVYEDLNEQVSSLECKESA